MRNIFLFGICALLFTGCISNPFKDAGEKATKEFKTDDLKSMSEKQLREALVKERKLRLKCEEDNGARLSFFESLIFYIGGPIIIGLAIAGRTYLQIPAKPLIITGAIFTVMPQIINIANELGDWFILVAKIGSGVALVAGGIYAAIKYKQRIARLVHYGQFATQHLNDDGKVEFNKAFEEDAKSKGLSHSDDDKKLVAGVKNILDKTKRLAK
jgi:hypothetical protein